MTQPKTDTSVIAGRIAAHINGTGPRPVLAKYRLINPRELLTMALLNTGLHHARFTLNPDHTITAQKLMPGGPSEMRHLGIHTAARDAVRQLVQETCTLTALKPSATARTISELCSRDPSNPAKTPLFSRALNIEEVLQARLFQSDMPLRILDHLQVPLTLDTYNAVAACRQWLPQDLSEIPDETAVYFIEMVLSPTRGRPYPTSPDQLLQQVRTHQDYPPEQRIDSA